MAKIGKIFLDFEAGVAKFNEPIKRAKRNVDQFGGAARKTKGQLAVMDGGILKSVKNLKALAGVAAALMVFRQLSRVFADAAKELDNLAKTSAKLGVAVQELQQLQVAAQITGIETRTLNMAMQRLVRRVSEAAIGTGEAVKALKELNLDAKELNKMPLAEKMAVISDAFKNLGSDADRVRIAMRLFDSEGVALVNTLALSKEEMDSINSTLVRFNYYLTQTQVEKVEKMNDSWLGMKILLAGIRNQFVSAIAPAMTFIINATIELFMHIKQVTQVYFHFTKQVTSSAIPAMLEIITKNFARLVGAVKVVRGSFALMASVAVSVFSKVLDVVDGLFEGMVEKVNIFIGKINKLPLIEITPFVAPFEDMRNRVREAVGSTEQFLLNEGKQQIEDGINAILNAEGIDGDKFVKEKLIEPFQAFLDKINETSSIFAPMQDIIDDASGALDEMGGAANKAGDLIASSLSRGIVQGEKLGNVLDNIIKQLVQNDLTKLITGMLPGFGAGGGLTDVFRGFFGGPKAMGGSVKSGKSYLVGERGPELFSPNVAGRITPNNKLGGGPVVVNNYFDISGGNDEIQDMIAESVTVSVDLAIARNRELKQRGSFA